MTLLARSMQGASLVVLAFMLATTPGRAGDFTFTSVDDDHIAWEDPANWAGPGALPAAGDDATISAGLLRGAEVKDSRAVNTLVLDSGLNVYAGGKLTVTNGITANAGYFINDGTTIADVVNNNYIASTGNFIGDVANTSTGATINDGADDGRTGVWTGDVVSNSGYVVNSYGIWNGDVLNNTGIIDNANGAVWNGNINNAADFYSIDSTVNGNLVNGGGAIVTGILRGNIRNSGTVWMDKPLSGVGRIANTGRIGMEDGAADDVLSARSWSGTGVLTVDFDPATMSSDRVVLSGNYSADTTLELRLLSDFPAQRKLGGTVPIVVVGGKDSGSLVVDGLPEGGIIAYALVRDGNGWVIAAAPGDAADHVAELLALTSATLGHATQADLGDACGRGVSLRGLHGGARTADARLDFSGAQLGLDLACFALPQSGATLGIGLTLGVASGTIAADYNGAPVDGQFDQRFAGVAASLVDGAFRAILEGQLAGTTTRLTDPLSELDAATLEGINARFSGTAGYALALGPVSLTPELGLALSGGDASAADFGDVGAVRFGSGPTLAAHTGVTLAADLVLGEATLSPFASVSLHGNLISGGATFTDSAGTSAALATAGRAPYVALALGANLVHAGALDAGLRADLQLAAGRTDTTLSGHLKVSF